MTQRFCDTQLLSKNYYYDPLILSLLSQPKTADFYKCIKSGLWQIFAFASLSGFVITHKRECTLQRVEFTVSYLLSVTG